MVLQVIPFIPIFAVVFALLIITYVIYLLGKKYAGWDLKKSMMKALGLYEKPVGLHEDRIQKKVKQYQSFKDNLLLFVLLPLQVVIVVLWFITGGNWLVIIIPCVLVAPLVAVFWMGVMFVYTKKYTKKTALEVTVHESDTKRFSDHWGIETPERLEPGDARIIEARRIIEDALKRGPEEEKKPKKKKKESKTKPESETKSKEDEDFIYLVKKAFCDDDDPWHQSLVYSDVLWENHMNPLTTTTYIGKIPVDMPCSKVSFAQVDTIMELPFLMFVESKELIDRVKNRSEPLKDKPEQRETTKTTYDGLLSVISAGIIEVQTERITELEELVEQYKTSAGRTAGQMLDYWTRMGKREPPKQPLLTPSLKRYLKYAAIIAVIIALSFVAYQTALFWINYYAALSVPPPETEFFGVWGVKYLLKVNFLNSVSLPLFTPHPTTFLGCVNYHV